jgi:hypothetical protein
VKPVYGDRTGNLAAIRTGQNTSTADMIIAGLFYILASSCPETTEFGQEMQNIETVRYINQ